MHPSDSLPHLLPKMEVYFQTFFLKKQQKNTQQKWLCALHTNPWTFAQKRWWPTRINLSLTATATAFLPPSPPHPPPRVISKSNWAFMIMTELGNDRLCCSCFRVIGWFWWKRRGSDFRWPSSRPPGSQELSAADTNRLQLCGSTVFTVIHILIIFQ